MIATLLLSHAQNARYGFASDAIYQNIRSECVSPVCECVNSIKLIANL